MYYNASVLARPSADDLAVMGVRYLVVPSGVTPPVPGDVVMTADGYDLVDVGADLAGDLAQVERLSPTAIDVGPQLEGVPVRVHEAFDPGWSATAADGRPATIRADGPVMQVDLPPGATSVRLTYRDPWVTGSLAAGVAIWVVLGAGIVGCAVRERERDELDAVNRTRDAAARPR
jgi:hypothetical protein